MLVISLILLALYIPKSKPMNTYIQCTSGSAREAAAALHVLHRVLLGHAHHAEPKRGTGGGVHCPRPHSAEHQRPLGGSRAHNRLLVNHHPCGSDPLEPATDADTRSGGTARGGGCARVGEHRDSRTPANLLLCPGTPRGSARDRDRANAQHRGLARGPGAGGGLVCCCGYGRRC